MSAALAEVERLEAERRELTAELAGFGGASADPFAKRRLREVERELAAAWEERRREKAGARQPEKAPERGGGSKPTGKCSECGRDGVPIQARGMCGACYNRLVRRAKAGRQGRRPEKRAAGGAGA